MQQEIEYCGSSFKREALLALGNIDQITLCNIQLLPGWLSGNKISCSGAVR